MNQVNAPRPPPNSHHALPAHEVVLLLETDRANGLSESEAAARLGQFGPNILPAASPMGPFRRFILQLHHPLIYVLLAAGLITLVLNETVDSAVIFGVVVINAIVGFIQESKAEAALDALRIMVHTDARVTREGRERRILSEELVPGDLVAIEAGDKVPADLRVVAEFELEVDESTLTGESSPVAKDEVVLGGATPVADRRNMVYSGTLVTNGRGSGVVVATGTGTELGEIHRLVGTAENLATPLTRKLAWFSKVLTFAILGLAAATFAVGIFRGERATEMVTAAVALAVGAIPEGLPAAVTITLAIGVNRMARRRAVIRRMPAVETLGSTTVICSDKTGTLTENQMTVVAIWTPEGTYRVTGTGYQPKGEILDAAGEPAVVDPGSALHWTLMAGAACNEAGFRERRGSWEVIGDPTEAAMLVVASKAGLDLAELDDELPRIDSIPFNSAQKFMATLHSDRAGDQTVFVKGAAEAVLGLCAGRITDAGESKSLDRGAVLEAVEELARAGLRVLAVAVAFLPQATRKLAEDSLSDGVLFAGLHAMQDPPRYEAINAVKTCQVAGIEVKMITGDHATTAVAIARTMGILDSLDEGLDPSGDARVLTGEDLASLDPEELPAAVERAAVFARVSPEQKLRLVEGLQSLGHVVAMTGDGVNDAPALQQADIGVAMGRGGTEVAKEASDMILTDDDFATIEAAIEEGRGVFDNLTKFIVWTLPTNMGEGFVILAAILAGAALPITPLQILWINMTTAVALGLMLAFEPKEPEIMERPPRNPSKPLLTGELVARILLVSTVLVAGSWWLFRWELRGAASVDSARTAAMNLFVMVEVFYLFSCRSLTRSPWHLGIFKNRWVIGGVALQVVAQLSITYLPFMNSLFKTAPIGVEVWLRIFGVALLAVAVVAVDKSVRRRVSGKGFSG